MRYNNKTMRKRNFNRESTNNRDSNYLDDESINKNEFVNQSSSNSFDEIKFNESSINNEIVSNEVHEINSEEPNLNDSAVTNEIVSNEIEEVKSEEFSLGDQKIEWTDYMKGEDSKEDNKPNLTIETENNNIEKVEYKNLGVNGGYPREEEIKEEKKTMGQKIKAFFKKLFN